MGVVYSNSIYDQIFATNYHQPSTNISSFAEDYTNIQGFISLLLKQTNNNDQIHMYTQVPYLHY